MRKHVETMTLAIPFMQLRREVVLCSARLSGPIERNILRTCLSVAVTSTSGHAVIRIRHHLSEYECLFLPVYLRCFLTALCLDLLDRHDDRHLKSLSPCANFALHFRSALCSSNREKVSINSIPRRQSSTR